jgi:predicted Co/Zn/Cd cation transporter (cation efflux family)
MYLLIEAFFLVEIFFSTKIVLEFQLSVLVFLHKASFGDYAIIVDNLYSLISAKMPLLGLILWQIF